jgi:hypothetical protein
MEEVKTTLPPTPPKKRGAPKKPKSETIGNMTPTQLATLINDFVLASVESLTKDKNGDRYNTKISIVGFSDGVLGTVGAPVFNKISEAIEFVNMNTDKMLNYEYVILVPLMAVGKG